VSTATTPGTGPMGVDTPLVAVMAPREDDDVAG